MYFLVDTHILCQHNFFEIVKFWSSGPNAAYKVTPKLEQYPPEFWKKRNLVFLRSKQQVEYQTFGTKIQEALKLWQWVDFWVKKKQNN